MRSSTFILAAAALALMPALATAAPKKSAVSQAIPAPSVPTNPAELREQFVAAGQNLLAKGDAENAQRFFDRALAGDANMPEALMGAGDATVAAGRPVDATKYYQALTILRPADPRGYIGLARAFNAAYRPEDALKALGSLPAGPKSVTALVQTGIAHDLAGRNQQAQNIYADALKIAPKNLEVLRRMANSFALSGDYPAALSVLNKVAAEPDGVATVKVPLSMIYALDGQIDTAMKIIGTSDSDRIGAQRKAFFEVMTGLNPAERARAVHYNYIASDVINAQLARTQRSDAIPAAPVAALDAPASTPAVSRKMTKAAAGVTPGRPQMIAMPQADTGLVMDTSGQMASQSPPAAVAPAAAPIVRAQPLPAADRFWVQLGVAPTRQRLLQDWNRAAAKSGSGLNGMVPYLQPDIVKAQVVLRLVIGGYMDASTAQALSARLKASDVPVYLTRNALPADPLFP